VYRALLGIWGWALLATRTGLVEWHKVLMTQTTGRESWLRYLTPCRLNVEAQEVQPLESPAGDPVCSICRATT